jgi:hypothetical protein
MIRDGFSVPQSHRLLNQQRSQQRHAEFFSRSHNALIRVADQTRNVIETHEHTGDFKERRIAT